MRLARTVAAPIKTSSIPRKRGQTAAVEPHSGSYFEAFGLGVGVIRIGPALGIEVVVEVIPIIVRGLARGLADWQLADGNLSFASSWRGLLRAGVSATGVAEVVPSVRRAPQTAQVSPPSFTLSQTAHRHCVLMVRWNPSSFEKPPDEPRGQAGLGSR
jgi:hypothetical protein